MFLAKAARIIKSRTLNNDSYANTAHYDVNRSYQVNGLNQYTSAGAASFTHDANGNLTSDGSVTFIYDVENRLVQAMGAKQATLTYDPMGRLWEVDGTAAGGTITRFLYDGDALVAEYDAPGNLTDRYVHGVGADVPTQWYEGSAVNSSTRHHLFANWQGSIALITNASGNTVNINAYDAYGIANETNIGRFQYTGQIAIPELGLYHYKARVYSPTLGRFLQTDPIGYEDQVNLYAYVGNDPVNLVDPTGEQTACASSGSCPTLTGRNRTARNTASAINRSIRTRNETFTSKISDNATVTVNVGEEGNATVTARVKVGPIKGSVTVTGQFEPVEGKKSVNIKVDSISTTGSLGEVRSAPDNLKVFTNTNGNLAIQPDNNLNVDVEIPFVPDLELEKNKAVLVE